MLFGWLFVIVNHAMYIVSSHIIVKQYFCSFLSQALRQIESINKRNIRNLNVDATKLVYIGVLKVGVGNVLALGRPQCLDFKV